MTQGFTPKRRTFRLEFDDPDLEGLTVKARSASVAEFLTITELATAAGDLDGEDPAALAEGMAQIRALFVAFSGVVTEWNLADEAGVILPVGVDSLLAQDFPVVMAVIQAWMSGVADVSGPLGRPSPGGVTGPTGDPVMEAGLAGLSSLAS